MARYRLFMAMLEKQPAFHTIAPARREAVKKAVYGVKRQDHPLPKALFDREWKGMRADGWRVVPVIVEVP